MEIKEDRVILRATLKIPNTLTLEERDRIIKSFFMDKNIVEKHHIEFSTNPADKDEYVKYLTPLIEKIEKLMADAAYQKELLGYLDTGSYIRVINQLSKPQQDQLSKSITNIEDVMVELSKTGKLAEAFSNVIKLLRMTSGDLDTVRVVSVGSQTMDEVIARRKKIPESVFDGLGIRQV
jgi:hypothetical protein